MSGRTPPADLPVISIPVVRDDASAEFFDGAREGRFLLRRCPRTGVYLDPRAQVSPDGEAGLEWAPASGRGRIMSWSVVHRGQAPPVLVGIVELDEGPWWWTRLIDLEPGPDLTGTAVEVVFVPSGPNPEHEPIPVFRRSPD